MSGVFACPECGRELELEGLSPGRQVQCESCSTWVEVPFLPRAAGWKRGRFPRERPAWQSRLLRGALVFAGVVLIALTAGRMIGGRVRSGKERVLAELVASADEAFASGRYDVALREIEGAVAQARTIEREGSERLAGLLRRRDEASVREAEARLAAVGSLDPDRAVGESLTLKARAARDPALAPLADAIAAGLDESRLRQARADLDLARKELGAGRDDRAFAAAERLHARAEKLPDPDDRTFRDAARSVLEAAVGRSGVALPPVVGKFAAGSAGSYTAALEKPRAESLRRRGYLPQPRDSDWAALWVEKAPYRQTIEVAESYERPYLQSNNRTTLIDAGFELSHGGRSIWRARAFARTRVPLPDLPAYVSGHIGTAGRRDPDAERRLQKDALGQFIEQAGRSFRGLPARPAPGQGP